MLKSAIPPTSLEQFSPVTSIICSTIKPYLQTFILFSRCTCLNRPESIKCQIYNIYIHWKPTWHISDYIFVSVSMKKKCIILREEGCIRTDSWILHSSWFQILFHFGLLFRSYESLRGLIDMHVPLTVADPGISKPGGAVPAR